MCHQGSVPSLRPTRLSCLTPAAIAVLTLLSVTGCSSSDVALSGPTAKCQVAVDNSLPTAPAGGATGTLTVTTTPECTWDVSTATNWIAITSASHLQGSGTVTYQVSANADASVRAGTLSVNATEIPITQSAAACRYTVTPGAPSIGATGGAVEIQVETAASCRWDVAVQANWIHVGGSPVARGRGRLTLTIDANGGPARNGSVTVGDQTVTVRQAAAADTACVFQIMPPTTSVPAEGGTVPIAVTAAAGCLWDATSQATWITIAGSTAGAGAGAVPLSIAANPGGARTGIVVVAGQTVTVTQAAASGPPCTFAVSPTTASIPAGGGTLPARVTTNPTCVWQVGASASWIVADTPQTTGPGTVQLSVAANPGAGRSATATVAGQTVTVTQAAAVAQCSFVVTPLQTAVAAAGGSGSITVAAPNGCAWTTSKNASWLTITSGLSGAGNGTVTFAVSANGASSPRADTLSVAGQAVTISQPGAASCEYNISPASANVDKGGTAIPVNVTTGLGCAWTAQPQADWLSVVAGASGTGSGVARVQVEKLTGAPRDRVGTVTIAGRTLTVTQVK